MINHLRTLLLNARASSRSPSTPGEEFVDPRFEPVTLTGSLAFLQTYLLGRGDRASDNYRLKLWLTILQTSIELRDCLYRHDTRVTYLPETTTPFLDRFLAGPQITQTGGTSGFFRLDGYDRQRSNGPLRTFGTAEVISSSQIRFTLQNDRPETPTVTTVTYTASSGVANVPLPGFGSLFAVFSDTVNAAWSVDMLIRPEVQAGAAIIRLENLLDNYDTELFAYGTVEPYKSWRAIVHEHPNRLTRFSALLLSLAERIEEARSR